MCAAPLGSWNVAVKIADESSAFDKVAETGEEDDSVTGRMVQLFKQPSSMRAKPSIRAKRIVQTPGAKSEKLHHLLLAFP
jgi:hypothetical protein